ncbi:unnamed protein product [Cyclocybe aegerita]|uniref:Auxin efflux carrier n=1 Tax=Cyclocybe aegerita TaxID=1973307 RepID=A0A8S0XQ00_CYCAE|nr:unnamed protein product [Cyclocybe aegerita]
MKKKSRKQAMEQHEHQEVGLSSSGKSTLKHQHMCRSERTSQSPLSISVRIHQDPPLNSRASCEPSASTCLTFLDRLRARGTTLLLTIHLPKGRSQKIIVRAPSAPSTGTTGTFACAITMVSAGTLIWISCRPLIRLFSCVAGGIIITKADIFPPVAARGASQIVLNIAIPCLMFSKIVPAFTSENVSTLGPLVLVAIIYEIMGALLAVVIKQFFWVPHRFRNGIIVAGAWGNVGDIPTSVVMSVTGAAPFHGVTDQNLAIAYISAFILVFLVTLFPLGGHHLIAQDYKGPDVEIEETREAMKQKRVSWILPFTKFLGISAAPKKPDLKHPQDVLSEKVESSPVVHEPAPRRRHVAFIDDATTVVPTEGASSPVCSPPPTEIDVLPRIDSLDRIASTTGVEAWKSGTPTKVLVSQEVLPTHRTPTPSLSSPEPPRTWSRFLSKKAISSFLKSLFIPPSVSILLAFPIAIVPKLKALFVEVPGTYMPAAPDGQPPLAFILDATTFIGAASVPLGLICLGSSLARLPIPKRGEWKMLPLGAISWLAIGKMILMPVLGVLMCEGLTTAGIIDEDDKVLRFVCIFLSCLPTATTQVFLTQVYSGTGSAEHLSAFLIPQYIIMFISMTAVIAYTLQLLF